MSAIHALTMTAITGEPVAFAGFRNQALLIVNLASH